MSAPASRVMIGTETTDSWLRRTLPIVRSHRTTFLMAIIGSFVALVLQVQIPTVIGRAIDGSLVHGDRRLTPYVVILAVLVLGRWVVNMVSRTQLLNAAYRVEYELRTVVFDHLTTLSYPFYDRVQSGELLARANSDVRSVQMYLATAPIIITQCLVAVVVVVQMLLIDPVLALVSAASLPAIAVVGVAMRRRLFPMSWLIQARIAEVATVVDENINGVRVVRSFAAEEAQIRSMTTVSQRYRWALTEDANLRSRWSPLVENLPRVGQALLLLVGGIMATNGSVTIGTVIAFNAYIALLQPPFRMLGLLLMTGQRAKASAQRIFAVLDTPPSVDERPGAVDLPVPHGVVEFRDVTFGYQDGSPVLDHLSLRLEPGETVALVGRSGSGTSTIGRLLARYYDVTDGAVLIDGTDVRDATLSSVRKAVGMVVDDPFLFSATIRENISFGRPDAPLDDVVAAAVAAGADEFIEDLADGYDSLIGERGYTLSGGQRQRIAIARALVSNPPVLVLDDATSAIDAQLEQRIHRSLREAMVGRTTVVVGHRLSTIALADRVALIDGGRVVATGTHADLLATVALYSEILTASESAADAARAAGVVDSVAAAAESGATAP